jgi:hypothetical protein
VPLSLFCVSGGEGVYKKTKPACLIAQGHTGITVQRYNYFLNNHLFNAMTTERQKAEEILISNIQRITGLNVEAIKQIDSYEELADIAEANYEYWKEEGKIEERMANAKKMLAKGMSVADISDITGLNKEEIEGLK